MATGKPDGDGPQIELAFQMGDFYNQECHPGLKFQVRVCWPEMLEHDEGIGL